MIMKYEYKIVFYRDYLDEEKLLNAWAGEGWRLIAVISGPTYYFEREL